MVLGGNGRYWEQAVSVVLDVKRDLPIGTDAQIRRTEFQENHSHCAKVMSSVVWHYVPEV